MLKTEDFERGIEVPGEVLDSLAQQNKKRMSDG